MKLMHGFPKALELVKNVFDENARENSSANRDSFGATRIDIELLSKNGRA